MHKVENGRIMMENVSLIKEINELRRECKLLKVRHTRCSRFISNALRLIGYATLPRAITESYVLATFKEMC